MTNPITFDVGRIPPQLRESLLHGKAAAEIGWGSDGDFDRCVAFLRRHDVPERMVKGECAELHKEANGFWPGRGRSHHAIDDTMQALVASMGTYAPVYWRGPLAPIGSPTGDRRIFPPDTITQASFPQPLRWQEHGMPGHESAVVVASITSAYEGEWNGQPHIVAEGYFLNPEIIPEVTKAIHLVANGVAGPSVDLDTFTGTAVEFNGKTMLAVTEGRQRGATLVSIPAFADLRLELEYPREDAQPGDDIEDLVTPEASTDDPLGQIMEMSAETQTFGVNGSGWRGAPVAPRDAEFNADEAAARIEAYAGIGGDSPDVSKMSKMFLWVAPNEEGPLLGREGYRLPWGDIFDGKPYLVYHAIYAASALLEGGHGGLPNIPDEDKAKLRTVISEIYAKLAAEFGDPNIQASWDRDAAKAQAATETETFATDEGGLVASAYDGIHPPKAAFAQRNLGRKTKMTVVPRDGYNEVYGHLADWDTCHMGAQIGQPGLCIKPPRSKRNYADFHVSTVLTAEGDVVDVGKLTIDTYHGSTRRGLTAAQVRAHYEHTGTEAAVGRVYEDEFGPAFFGVQVPDNDAALAQKIRRTPVSGHWHPVNGHLELVAALGVNRPAYPIVASAAGEQPQELVADGPVVWFEDGVQAGLIAGASFGTDLVEEFATEEPVAVENDCGCSGTPDPQAERVARIMGYSPIPTAEQQAALRLRLAAHLDRK